MIDDNNFNALITYLDRLIQLHDVGVEVLDSVGNDAVTGRIKQTLDVIEETITK